MKRKEMRGGHRGNTSVRAARRLARQSVRQEREDRLARMTPQARASYHRIMRLRDEIGPVGFDVAQALREIREDE